MTTLVLFGTGGARVVAQAPTEHAEARHYFERGNEFYQRAGAATAGRHEQLLERALSQYLASLRITRSRNALFNAAVVLSELARHDDAFNYYSEYLAIVDLSEDERQQAEHRREALRAHVAVLAVNSEPSGATCWIDRRDLPARGTTPLEVAVTPGEHKIVLERVGYETSVLSARADSGRATQLGTVQLKASEVRVTFRARSGLALLLDGKPVQAGKATLLSPGAHEISFEANGRSFAQNVRVQLGADEQAFEVRVPSSSLSLSTSADAEVYIDDVRIGRGPKLVHELEAGFHRLRVSAAGRDTVRRRIELPAQETLALSVFAPPTENRARKRALRTMAIGSAGLLVAAVGLSVGAFRVNQRFEDAAQASPPRLDTANKLADRTDRLNIAADVTWSLTAATTATALALWIRQRREHRRLSPDVSGSISSRGVFVSAQIPLGVRP